jgi:hypothetical protein
MLQPPRKPPLNPQPSPAATPMSSLKPKQSSATYWNLNPSNAETHEIRHRERINLHCAPAPLI